MGSLEVVLPGDKVNEKCAVDKSKMTSEDTLAVNQTSDLTVEHLMDIAVVRSGLKDFGPDQFIMPLSVLLKSMREEADLSSSGLKAQSERLINALISRLRKTDLIKSHPEVLDEDVRIAGVIVSLPRTGSTMLHRLLASSPKLTATKWWETIFPLPFPGDEPSDVSARVSAAESLVEKILSAASNFESIHPLSATAFDEELTLIEQSFMSNMPESMMYVPSYGEWLLEADQTHAYEELLDYLKILQWQFPERQKQQWILKSPHHLTSIQTVLKLFPDAVIINTHRDVSKVMPSWYSMVGSLTEADSDADSIKTKQAEHWSWRLEVTLREFLQVRRDSVERFVDIGYGELMADPVQVCRDIYDAIGCPFESEDKMAFVNHVNDNKRDKRPTHTYQIGEFGVSEKQIKDRFSFYTNEFSSLF